jgi:2-polyprenyl-3-methyl-5-hydroxy-6-metoxy-1,4-benzoquinol methylase
MTEHQTLGAEYEDIDEVKRLGRGTPKFRLRNANVLQSPRGVFYTDHLDPVEDLDPTIVGDKLDAQAIQYIEKSLQSNNERFRQQIETIQGLRDIRGARILDIGCGGGKFLAMARELGAEVTGLELEDSRAFYAKSVNGLDVRKCPIEDEAWRSEQHSYDIVTLWDVIEHVNYPHSTLKVASQMLKPGGFLVIDTPCKDSFYHRFGQFTYALTRGAYPTFLSIMYSSHLFGHKQIFSTKEMQELLSRTGLSVRRLEKFHELSFPLSFYLFKLTRSKILTRMATPVAAIILHFARIKNKMLVVAEAN